jgi:hypothetical protein
MAYGQRDLFTKRVRRAPPAPEFHLHCMIADVLTRWATPGWVWTHIASGEYRTPATAARLKRLGVRPGWPDLILISPAGTPHFLELKRRGGRLSDAQRHFENWCKASGVAFACCDKFDDAIAMLKTWGAVIVSIS